MSEWLWIAFGVTLIFALVYALSRGPEAQVARATADGPSPADPPPSSGPARTSAPAEMSGTRTSSPPSSSPSSGPTASAKVLPKMEYEEDDDVDPTKVGAKTANPTSPPPAKRIVYDEDAANDEPTHSGALIL